MKFGQIAEPGVGDGTALGRPHDFTSPSRKIVGIEVTRASIYVRLNSEQSTQISTKSKPRGHKISPQNESEHVKQFPLWKLVISMNVVEEV